MEKFYVLKPGWPCRGIGEFCELSAEEFLQRVKLTTSEDDSVADWYTQTAEEWWGICRPQSRGGNDSCVNKLLQNIPPTVKVLIPDWPSYDAYSWRVPFPDDLRLVWPRLKDDDSDWGQWVTSIGMVLRPAIKDEWLTYRQGDSYRSTDEERPAWWDGRGGQLTLQGGPQSPEELATLLAASDGGRRQNMVV